MREKDFYTAAEAIQRFITAGISESTLFRLLKRKELKGFKVGRIWKFEEEDIKEYIQRQREKTAEELPV